MNRTIEGYYMWASFKFLYRSALDIHTAGFDRVDTIPNLSSNINADRSTDMTSEMANVQLATASTTAKEPVISLEASSDLSINRVDSCTLQPPGLGPVKSPNDSGITGYVGIVKEELQAVIPPRFTNVSYAAAAASHGDQKAGESAVQQQ